MNNFYNSLAIGKQAEEAVKAHLEKRGITVIDVSNIKEYQKIDVDFLLRKGNQETTLEVKHDRKLHKTGNFFFECGFFRGANYSAGWLKYCQAQYLCYYDTDTKHGYIIDFAETLPLLKQHAREVTFYDKADGKQGKALLLSVNKAKRLNLIKYEWED